ncbi:helix-turn-helix transcriptional regulator [Roseateles sp.]|uniref:helix-turn-helix transcriptional regulator n=1 Tax=Roseateles sp. TaxID=1971397 RepID=UPI0039E87509
MHAPSIASDTNQFEANPADTLRLPTVCRRTGLGRTTIYRLMAHGLFPSSVRLAPRAIGWHRADIDAWLAARSRASH